MSSYGQIQFQRIYTDGSTAARSVAATTEGGYIFTGEGLSVTKTDQYGDIVWSNTYSGTIGRSILQLSNNNYLVVGETSSDLYVMKLDVDGNVLWAKTYGGMSSDYGWAADQALDDGYIICGYTKSFGQGGADVYLLRIGDDGSLLWSKTYGGSGHDYGRTVIATPDGGFLVGGDTFSYGAGSSDVYLIKTDANGVMQWSRTIGGLTYELGYSLALASDGNYVMCGYTNSYGAGGNDGYLLKISASGNLLWSKTFGGTGNDYCWSVKKANDNGYIICGYTNSFGPGNNDVYLIKTDDEGVVEWSKIYNGGLNEYGQDIIAVSSGEYVVCGWSDSYSLSTQNELYLMRINGLGESGCNENSAATTTGAGGSQSTGGTENDAASTVTDLQSSSPLLMGITSVCDSMLTSEEMLDKEIGKIKVYPNPFSSWTTFEFRGAIEGYPDLQVINSIGQIMEVSIIQSEDQIKLIRRNLPAGVYFYQVRIPNKVLGKGKLVIR